MIKKRNQFWERIKIDFGKEKIFFFSSKLTLNHFFTEMKIYSKT